MRGTSENKPGTNPQTKPRSKPGLLNKDRTRPNRYKAKPLSQA